MHFPQSGVGFMEMKEIFVLQNVYARYIRGKHICKYIVTTR